MARIRTIKPEIWTDEKFMAVSHGARLLFIGMFNFADDNGDLLYSITELQGRIFPGDEEPAVEYWLTELINIGLVIDYEVEGQKEPAPVRKDKGGGLGGPPHREKT